MDRFSRRQIPAFLFFFSLLAVASQLPAQMGKINTSHVSDDSFLVLRFDLEKIRSQIPMGSKDLELITRAMKEEAGLDLNSMTAITVQFGAADDGPFDASFCITFEHSKKIDRKSFHENSEFDLDEYTETMHAGKKYLRNQSDGGPHLFFSADEKAFTMATAKAVESVIEAGSGMGKMAGLLKSAPPEAEVAFAYKASSGYQEILEELVREIPLELPFDLVNVLEDTKFASGSIQVKSSTPIFIQATCKSPQSASDLKSALSASVKLAMSGVAVGKVFVESRVKELESQAEDDRFAKMELKGMKLASDGLKLGEKILTAAKVESRDNVCTFKVSTMGGIKEAIPNVVGAFNLMFMGISGRSDGRALPPKVIDDDFKKE